MSYDVFYSERKSIPGHGVKWVFSHKYFRTKQKMVAFYHSTLWNVDIKDVRVIERREMTRDEILGA